MVKLRVREKQLVLGVLKWNYKYGLQRKNEWLNLPEFVRGKRSFSVYLENLILESK